jgi:hypothetical protein
MAMTAKSGGRGVGACEPYDPVPRGEQLGHKSRTNKADAPVMKIRMGETSRVNRCHSVTSTSPDPQTVEEAVRAAG